MADYEKCISMLRSYGFDPNSIFNNITIKNEWADNKSIDIDQLVNFKDGYSDSQFLSNKSYYQQIIKIIKKALPANDIHIDFNKFMFNLYDYVVNLPSLKNTIKQNTNYKLMLHYQECDIFIDYETTGYYDAETCSLVEYNDKHMINNELVFPIYHATCDYDKIGSFWFTFTNYYDLTNLNKNIIYIYMIETKTIIIILIK